MSRELSLPASERSGDDRRPLRDTWSIDRRRFLRLGVAFVVFVGVFTSIGFVVTDIAAPNVVTRLDDDVAEWFASSRTPFGDDLAHWGAFLASTEVKIAVTALLAIVALAAWRRWHESLFLATTLIFEATVFIVVTFLVSRPRPDVPRLEDSPVDSSFPSGHVAAATVYGSFVVIVFWHTTSRRARAVAVTVATTVVVAVGWSRVYQGMHFLSDVVAGFVLGLSTLAVCLVILGRPSLDGGADAPNEDRLPCGDGRT